MLEFQKRLCEELLNSESSLTVLAPGLGIASVLASLIEFAYVPENSMRRPGTLILGASEAQVKRAKAELKRRRGLPDAYDIPEVTCFRAFVGVVAWFLTPLLACSDNERRVCGH